MARKVRLEYEGAIYHPIENRNLVVETFGRLSTTYAKITLQLRKSGYLDWRFG